MTQSASMRMTISAWGTARPRLIAAACRAFGPGRTRARAWGKAAHSARGIVAVSSVDPSSDTRTCTGPPYRPAATSIERSSLAMLSASLYAGMITSTGGRSRPGSGSFLFRSDLHRSAVPPGRYVDRAEQPGDVVRLVVRRDDHVDRRPLAAGLRELPVRPPQQPQRGRQQHEQDADGVQRDEHLPRRQHLVRAA